MDWQPIETAPNDGTEILVWVGYSWNGRGPVCRTSKKGKFWSNELMNGSAASNFSPTHWTPMPERPQ